MLVGRCAPRTVVYENPLTGTEYMEDVIVIDDGLRPAQEEVASVIEGHVEDREQVSLQYILKIDQQIPAADQVQSAEGRILEDIVLGEHDHLADIVIDNIAVGLFGKEPAQAGDRDVLQNTVSVDASSGNPDGIPVQIRREYFHIPAQTHLVHGFREENSDRVGFLTCGTACHPDADLVGCPVAGQQILDDPLLEHFKIIRVAEEGGDANQDLFGQKAHFLRVIGHIIDIFLQIAVVRDDDPSLDPPQHRGLLVVGIVDVGNFFQDEKHLGDQVAVRELQTLSGVRDRTGDVGHLTRYAVRIQDQVGEARRDRAPRHAVEFGALRSLDDDQSVAVLDRADSVRAVRARPREDDRHRPVLVGFGQ